MAFLLAISTRKTNQTQALVQETSPSHKEMLELCDALEKIRGNGTAFNARIVSHPNNLKEHAKNLAGYTNCRDAAKLLPDGKVDISGIDKCEKVKDRLLEKIQQSENRIEQIWIHTMLMSHS